ncbi:DUF3043 domain-containing protein [Nocardioides sp. LMS-CY]|uniref:DUF3043 domain-containing protein n=1 Tax=Nocardioides soli TaxID=1036020 RepID=A0A7W4VRI1_9ACTN|nr:MULTISPECIES: DUF3043 domain-containing protein [Nocardioides]MBB3040451.1 hypothetical protein [Nocardioides soli]QWF24073.1 DUF3043 domain-containing protein [Nocardioides sp. LMS-CY]
MFRRSKSEPAPEPTPTKVGGKGRPTPTRKEAEAAAKARVKQPRTRKEQSAAQRKQRSESSKTVRQAMRDGDERYFPARDKGPVRRFIRDYVDARFSMIELVIPLLLITMILGYSGNPSLAQWGNTLLLVIVIVVLFDMFWLRFRLRRELARRFPDKSLKGTTYYAITRAMQMKFMRLPKPRVKIGQALPDDYDR